MKKIGIIGCGKIAQTRHIPEYADNKNAELAGYYDLNTERAKQIADLYGGKVYGSPEEMLADTEIDAVSVCTANNAHAEMTVQALRAGKHVLCEKPMATKIEDCERMVAEAERNQRFLMIGQNQRLTKAHVKAKELLEKGAIGRVLTFRTTFGHGGPETWSIDPGKNGWFFDKKKAAMGAMADLGVHKTDLIQYLTGQNIVEVTAAAVTLDKRDAAGELVGVDDNAICIYRMADGALGTMSASWTHYGEEDNSTVLYGTEGVMKIYENPQYAIEIISKTGEKVYYDLEKIQTNNNQTKSGIIDAFVEALEKEEEPPVSGGQVLAAMRAVFAGIQSAETKKSVHIKENEMEN